MTGSLSSAWRLRLAAAAALAAVTALLLVPTPGTPAPTAADTGVPPTLAGLWPAARTIDVPANLPDGASFAPAAVLDPHTLVVQITAADNSTTALALLTTTDPGHPRILQQTVVADGGSFDAVTVAGGRVYWIASVSDDEAIAHSTVYRADPNGAPVALTADTGRATFSGSQYDLQVVDGRVWWTATRGTYPPTTDLRSVPVDGGPVTVRPLDGTYRLTAWPWSGSDGIAGQPVTQVNLTTGERRTIPVPAGQELYCGATWCRAVVVTEQSPVVSLRRADGTGPATRVNTDGEQFLFIDVAALDRFEVLATPISNQGVTSSERLAMYDLNSGKHIALAVSTSEGIAGSWLWWATGDNETLTWHLLDLTTLR